MSNFRVLWTTARGPEAVRRVRDHMERVAQSDIDTPLSVFDIDDTLLVNSDTVEDAIAVNGVGRDMYRSARRHEVPVYAVTARDHTRAGRAYTKGQLEALRYKCDGLYMIPRAYVNDADPARFKSDARARIRQKTGGTIILSVGDQMTDHLGPTDTVLERMRPDMYYGLGTEGHPELLSVKLPEYD